MEQLSGGDGEGACAPDRLAVAETLALFAETEAWPGVHSRASSPRVPDALPENTQQLFLGDEDYVERVAVRVEPTSKEIPRRQRAVRSLAHFERTADDRDEAIRAAYASGTYTLQAIGEHFGLHYATVSRIARQAMSR